MTGSPNEPPDRTELLQIAVDSAADFAILTTDPRGDITSWSVGAERLLGYTEAEIRGRSADLIFVEEDCAAGVPDLERRKADSEGRAIDERWHRRKDGTQFWGSGLMMPLRRGGTGYIKIMRDRTEQHQAEARLAESEERFRILATTIPQLVFRTRNTGARSWGSPQWEVYAGLSDAESREFGWLEAIHPDDRQATRQAWTGAVTAGRYDIEHRIRRAADGAYRWHQTRALPAAGPEAPAGEWVGTSTDIHDLRSLQDRQQVLLAELQHRTRNLLAVVQAMARQTMRSSRSLEAFAAEYESRLRALSRVQSLVASTPRETLALRRLVEAELRAHHEIDGAKIRIDGPEVDLPMEAVQTLALALHELAINAVKHGAIGQPDGRLSVRWEVDAPTGSQRQVVLDWRETGVAMPDPAAIRKGYGSELIERALPYQLRAETALVPEADGIRCTIRVPMTASEGAPA